MLPPAWSRKAWDISALIAAIFGDYGGTQQEFGLRSQMLPTRQQPPSASRCGRLLQQRRVALSENE